MTPQIAGPYYDPDAAYYRRKYWEEKPLKKATIADLKRATREVAEEFERERKRADAEYRKKRNEVP